MRWSPTCLVWDDLCVIFGKCQQIVGVLKYGEGFEKKKHDQIAVPSDMKYFDQKNIFLKSKHHHWCIRTLVTKSNQNYNKIPSLSLCITTI